MNYEKTAEKWLKNCSDHRGEQVIELGKLIAAAVRESEKPQRNLIDRWRELADDNGKSEAVYVRGTATAFGICAEALAVALERATGEKA